MACQADGEQIWTSGASAGGWPRALKTLALLPLLLAPGAAAAAGEAAGGGEAGAIAARGEGASDPDGALASSASLQVVVREVPPFAMRDPAGHWEGLSVELWQAVAERLGVESEWVEQPLEKTLESLAAGEVDVGVAALTITAERERRFDFSHTYYVSGLSLAVPRRVGSAWGATLAGFFSLEFLTAVGTLALVLLVVGLAVWLFERRKNAEEFGRGSSVRGVGDGFWWSAVTMTTVGYGDKSPRTLGGRLVALVWMFASLIVIAGFTASIAASLTANRLASSTLLAKPLSELEVGVLERSAADAYATDKGATVRRFGSIDDALDGLARGEHDVVLHDAPVLKHRVRLSFETLEVVPRVLVRDDYGFGLPPGSSLRESLNGALLSVLREPVWQRIRGRYLGDEGPE